MSQTRRVSGQIFALAGTPISWFFFSFSDFSSGLDGNELSASAPAKMETRLSLEGLRHMGSFSLIEPFPDWPLLSHCRLGRGTCAEWPLKRVLSAVCFCGTSQRWLLHVAPAGWQPLRAETCLKFLNCIQMRSKFDQVTLICDHCVMPVIQTQGLLNSLTTRPPSALNFVLLPMQT